MAYRHGSSTFQMFEANHDQNWNHTHPEEPFVHLPSSSFIGNNTRVYHHVDYMEVDGAHHVSLWNPSASGISSSSEFVHAPHNQSDVHHNLQSNYIVENTAPDPTVDTNWRRHYKRKSPMIPSSIETRGTASGFLYTGSSSNTSYERQNVDNQHFYNPPFGGESFHRNVRSRSSVGMDVDVPIRPHRGTNYPVDHSSRGTTLPLFERSHIHTSAPSHGRSLFADSGNLTQDAMHFTIGSSSTSSFPGQMGRYSNDHSLSRNPGSSQRFHPRFGQFGGTHNSFSQRSNPTNWVETGGWQFGQAAPFEERWQFAEAESSSFRHPGASISTGRNYRDMSRFGLLSDNYQPFFADDVSHDHVHQGITTSSRSSLPGSRGLFGQRRESLDVDNMSYEELLALGERIGSVSTGLSNDQLLKCLKETTYLSSKQVLKEERCVICLEEYEEMDQIGSLKSCKHEYHVGCIKKWLSIKNACPICKAPALPDDKKKEKMQPSFFNTHTSSQFSYMPTSGPVFS